MRADRPRSVEKIRFLRKFACDHSNHAAPSNVQIREIGDETTKRCAIRGTHPYDFACFKIAVQ
jgi:hypothetical protein